MTTQVDRVLLATGPSDSGTTRASPVRSLGAWSALIERQLAEVVEHEIADPWLRRAVAYQLGWRDEQFEPLPPANREGGKKLRATLAILTYRTAVALRPGAGTIADRPLDGVGRVVPFAAAIELVHNWSLVHDDIEDGDRTRRGRPALWTVCGESQAINVGDCIYALAFRCLARLREQLVPENLIAEMVSELARTGVELTVGQMRDMAFEGVPAVTPDLYLEMVEGKTGSLIRCSAYGGALLGSGDRTPAQAFGEFGRQLGLGFQIRDDILGIWGTSDDTGKPVGADIRRRKKTLPVVLALERADLADRERLHRLYSQTSPMAPADESYVRDVLDRCDARGLSQEAARGHRQKALAALATAGPASADGEPHIRTLQALADFVTERTH